MTRFHSPARLARLLTAAALLALVPAQAQLGEPGKPATFKFDALNSRVPFVTMPFVNTDSLIGEDELRDAAKMPYRFGHNHLVRYSLDNSGHWEVLPNGVRTWRLGVNCPGAMTVNLAFEDFHLPQGAQLFVYTPDHATVLGAFTSKHNWADKKFGTELLPGESVIVEYVEPAAVAGQGTLTLFRVTHGYRSVSPFLESLDRGFGDAGNCHNNVHCPGAGAWQNEVRSAVCLVSGGSEFCSGALINNTCNDGTPYVLTADHCGPADGSWVFRFNWEASGCNDPSTNPSSQSLSGGTPRASNGGSDFHLCEINSVPPANYNVYYAGWSNVNTPADSVVCIHHPSGDIKKISWAMNPTTSVTWSGAQCWLIGLWTSGVTEPGSSGSPLFDQNHRIVGQLYGGASYCGAPPQDLNDYYGKFSTSWNTGSSAATRLVDWLDACTTGASTDNGYDPNQPTVALDAQMLAVNAPSGNTNTCTPPVSFTPSLSLRNAGIDTLTTATITYQLDSQTPQVYTWNGTLPTGQLAGITLPVISATAGTHTFTAIVSAPNNGSDGNPVNDTTSGTFTVTVLAPQAFPVVEGFQQPAFPPANWIRNNPDGDVTWVRTTATGSGSSASTRMDNFNNDNTGTRDELVTPLTDLTGVTSLNLTFDVAYARYDSQYSDTLAVHVSTDCGQTWTQVYLKGGSTLATAPDNTNAFQPSASQWRNETINLNSYVGQSSIQARFQNRSGYGNFMWLDNININVPSAITETDAGIFSIYPNPGSGLFTLDCSAGFAAEVQLSLCDVTGREVWQQQHNNLSSGRTTIDLSGMSEGVYFLQIAHEGAKSVKKLVIRKDK